MRDYNFCDGRRKQLNLSKWAIFFLLLLLLLGFFKRNIILKNNQKNVFSFISQKSKDPAPLLADIKKLITDKTGSWSIYVYDLSNNQEFGLNETTIFKVASVNKIPILASLYYFADKGEVNLDQQVTLQTNDIQDYGTGTIRYDPPGSVYSVKTLARLMMEKSDNTATYILGREILNFEKIQKLMESWGLTQTSMENNKTSLSDMGKLLVKMYRNETTNKAQTLEMLDFMDDSDFEDRIPVLLPKDIKVYHKTGDDIASIHDIGIVNLKNRPYILGVFTTDITDEATAKQIIAQISKLVFDWQQGN